ncbi:calcium homeostasis modulator protein 5 isoform X1 [Alligator mississippiensis]|uniref:calcium homeostasis modulator protein 5 isoform X1 n=1 Tax=Alligator mississippiensis TaxID=8496 RepID=UPI0009073001|nr:calcium homeostasis modulator protein 5 isoform X1 [Alligator mississippiensis]
MDGIQTVLKFLINQKTAIGYSFMALLTVGSERLFSVVAFKCPCSSENFMYGLVFLFAPALVLLVIGYFLNSRTWKLFTGCFLNPRKIFPKGNSCRFFYVFGQITLHALIAPVMWLSVALLNGTFYECAMSGLQNPGYLNVLCKNKSVKCWEELYKVVCDKTTMSFAESEELKLTLQAQSQEHKKILAAFPCSHLVPPELSRAKDEAILLLKYQSQVAGWFLIAGVAITVFLSYCLARCLSPLSFLHLKYWASYVRNEQKLFEEAADLHSRLYATQHIKKFFGLVPGSKDLREIRIPSCKDWRSISGVAVLRIVDEEHYDYSLLHDWAVNSSTNGKYFKIEESSSKNSEPPPST